MVQGACGAQYAVELAEPAMNAIGNVAMSAAIAVVSVLMVRLSAVVAEVAERRTNETVRSYEILQDTNATQEVLQMIQEKYLVEFYEAVRTSSHTNPIDLTGKMKEIAVANDIPVVFTSESVKFGSMLKSHIDDCLRLYHPDHPKDYFSIIVHNDNGKLVIYRYGFSKQLDKQMEKKQVKKSGGTFVKGLLTGHQPEDGYGGMFVSAAKMMQGTAGMLFHAVKSIGGSKSKMQEEEAWYDAVYAIICEANQ